jgi:two-component system response regulator RegA
MNPSRPELTSAPHFLLVDDDETFSSVLARALGRRGYRVSQANSFQDALERLAAEVPERAIVDLNLGERSGLQLIPALRQARPDMQILVLTGYSSIATAVEAIKLGAVNYLCKPAGADDILAALNCSEPDPSLRVPAAPPSVERLEWEHIQRVLQDNGSNISATARALGMHRRTLQRKLKKRPVGR